MILQALVRYYEDLTKQGKIARPGWAKSKINYALCINARGELEQVIPLLEDTGGKKPQPKRMDLPAAVKRTVGIAPNFLWDNASYLLGVDAKGKPERSVKCFEACRTFHHLLLDGADSTAAKGILAFLDGWEPLKAKEHPALRGNYDAIAAGGNLLFRVNGAFAQDDDAVCQAWQTYYDHSEGETQQCLVTGNEDVIEAVHPAIKGVDVAQSSGAAIVSFNASAFCSYGQEQSYNAPVGKYAAFAYTAALNHLLADRENVQKIGDTTVVCWAEGAEPQYQAFTFAALFGKTQETLSEGDVRDAVKKLANGQRVPELDLKPNQLFYILGLSPNAARLSVRFFYQGSFGDLMKNINAHHERMEIVRPSFDKYETIPIWAMLRETVKSPPKGKSWPEASPVLAGATARAIFTGGLYPAALLEQTMLRIRAERDISRGKAAIIKAYYLRNSNEECPKEVLTVALNEAST
ncbi:MAG: type I-C CRISPR-associated protein Cas8c/Csd1, partial [Oscillospiraceae bacterium]|nr:type I-C CRISPR-associated protein Cas8c/Csd1 [Oscillospiraceae bacterium]